MSCRHITHCIAAWLLACLQPLAAADSKQTIQLFDGKSLDGWTTATGKAVTNGWAVENGELVRQGRGGSIFTAKEFGDFDLSFEWKIAARGNSGVKYRVAFYKKGVHGNPGWLGCEYQIYDDAARRPDPKFSTGAIYELVAPSADKQLRPAGQYNTSRIVVRGTKIEHWLNDKRIAEADVSSEDWKKRIAGSKFGEVEGFFKNRKGRIELQDHGHKVWFRNITLRKLDAQAQSPTEAGGSASL
jgi:hypothetical protein